MRMLLRGMAAALLLALTAGVASAQAPFFQGKQIKVLVGFPPGGTTVLVGTGQLLVRLLLGLDGARAKVSDLVALVATPMGRITYASPATGIKVAKDALNPR